MADALPVPLESLTQPERERLRPVLARLAWERSVKDQYQEMLQQGHRSDQAIGILAVQESRAEQKSISARTIARVVWGH